MTLRKRFLHQGILISAVLLGAYLSNNIMYSSTNSTKYKVFWKTASVPGKDDYATFSYLESEYLSSRKVSDPFTKRLGCISPDILELRNDIYYCNGKYLGMQLKKDSDGNELPLFTFNGAIPEGMAFMVGDNPRSGDSRYFGLVDIYSAKKVIPLW